MSIFWKAWARVRVHVQEMSEVTKRAVENILKGMHRLPVRAHAGGIAATPRVCVHCHAQRGDACPAVQLLHRHAHPGPPVSSPARLDVHHISLLFNILSLAIEAIEIGAGNRAHVLAGNQAFECYKEA